MPKTSQNGKINYLYLCVESVCTNVPYKRFVYVYRLHYCPNVLAATNQNLVYIPNLGDAGVVQWAGEILGPVPIYKLPSQD